MYLWVHVFPWEQNRVGLRVKGNKIQGPFFIVG